MKKVWYIQEIDFTYGEGYISEYDENVRTDNLMDIVDENNKYITTISRENVFDNRETFLNMYRGMLDIQIRKNRKEIDWLEHETDILVNKKFSL